MRFVRMTPLAGICCVAATNAASLADICTVSHVQSSLPANGTFLGISLDSASVTASPVYNASSAQTEDYLATVTYDYCNVTLSYTHNGRGDVVNLWYWFPAPDEFNKRFLATGGGGYAITSTNRMLPDGVQYGAVAGTTDGGFGGFQASVTDVVLKANGSINWDAVYSFGYKAIGEMTQIGKGITRDFYSMGSDDKLYTYYQGCSEGGREGWSQVQRYPEEYDGVVPGAPAFRYAQQQVQHLYAGVVEQTMDYYPSNCELDRIINATIAFCDPLDGKSDGVVSRTDLCKLHFNVNSTIGLSYDCPASSGGGMGPPGSSSSTPAATGKVSAQGAAVVAKIMDGLHTTDGKRAYINYQPSAGFADATTAYNNATGEYELTVSSLGGTFVTQFIEEVDLANLPSLDNVTYDTLVFWMKEAQLKFYDSLQTTVPDLSPFLSRGGKIISYHGESDDSIPAGSSVHYHESVRNIMYPGMSFNESTDALGDWYRLFLVPGAAHCATNSLQPNGPFPLTNLAVMIDWVEKDVKPVTLNATHTAGDLKGQDAQLCAWPLRPFWAGNTTEMQCVYDQKSIDTWMYDFDAYKLPLY